MNSRIILFVIIILLYYWLKIFLNKSSSHILKNNIYNHDIIIDPGGYYGFYLVGICHFIKNNYNIDNKNILGTSAGAIAIIFLSIKNNLSNYFIKHMFYMGNSCLDIDKLTIDIFDKIENYSTFEDYNFKNKYIGTTVDGYKLNIYTNFLSISDILNCTKASLFIPYVTVKDFIFFYKGKLTLDGGLAYFMTKHNVRDNILNINYKMFGRFLNENTFIGGLYKPKIKLYDLYILGYHDALVNKKYFDKYLT